MSTMSAPDERRSAQQQAGEGLSDLIEFVTDRVLDFAKLAQRRDLDDAVTGDALAVTVRQIVQRTVSYVRRSRGWQ